MVITQPGASYNLKPGWYDGGNGKGSRSGLQVRYRDGHQGKPLPFSQVGFRGGSDRKESACRAGDQVQSLGRERREWLPTPVFLPGSPRGTPACQGTFGGRRKAVRDRLALQGGTGDFP